MRQFLPLLLVVGGAWNALLGCQSPQPNEPPEAEALPDSSLSREEVTSPLPLPSIPPLRELLGHVDPASDTSFAEIPSAMSSRRGLFLRTEACDAFKTMHDAAARDGIALTALSATRPFGHQAAIWNRKWNRPQTMGMAPVDRARHILLYSSMPGSSRHHWGTDVDIFSLEPEDFAEGTQGAKVISWLRERGKEFGFVEVYTPETDRPGYQPEAWHWSYAPLSSAYLGALNHAVKKGTMPPFEGFEGAQWADSLRVVEDYINGINPVLKR